VQPELLSNTLTCIADLTGIVVEPRSWRPVAGGDINQAACVRDLDGRTWFIKLNKRDRADMFAAECEGLRELAAAEHVYVPQVAGYGSSDQCAWLMLEWLDLTGTSSAADRRLGKGLARMHRTTAEQFGWRRDNYIGASTQPNERLASWPAFFRERRLGHQLSLAKANGAPVSILESGYQLMERLDDWFGDYIPVPSLLHGDLWGGNRGALPDGRPALFDPAVYYGDRETDIAMTRLFGGFDESFYAAYDKEWPLDKGATQRQALYNIYHVLNHFNLFGGSYLTQAEHMLLRLLST
jgi:protein-ribulosamine 3-kinase